MPKFYTTESSCGACNYMAAKKAGLKFDEVNIVDLATHKVLKDKSDFYKVNAKGNVPTIVLDDGTVLNENVSTLVWIAENGNADSGLLPAKGSERYAVLAALSHVATSVHPSTGPFWGHKFGMVDEAGFEAGKKVFYGKLDYLQTILGDKDYLVTKDVTIADLYAYICLTWMDFLGVSLEAYPKIVAFRDRVGALDWVKEASAELYAMKAEQSK